MTLNPEQFLTDVAGFTQARRARSNADRPTRLATVAYDHDPHGTHGANPRVQFDGEPDAGHRRYPTLFGYRPRPGERVLLIPSGRDTYAVAALTAPEPDEWIVIKDAPQSVTSSTTLVDDDELWVDVDAHATYRVILTTNVEGSTGGDVKLAWSVPAGADAGGRWVQGPYVSQDPAAGVLMQTRASLWADERSYGCSSAPNSIIEHGLLRTGAAGGRLQLRWAQNTSSATATTLLHRSNLWVKRF